jgi:hypothetical protein
LVFERPKAWQRGIGARNDIVPIYLNGREVGSVQNDLGLTVYTDTWENYVSIPGLLSDPLRFQSQPGVAIKLIVWGYASENKFYFMREIA